MTSIAWTDRTWNPVRGCSRVSPGCDHCYAMGQAHRFSAPGLPYAGLTLLRPKTAKRPGVDWSGSARFVPEMLSEPFKWRKPQRVFVNSMSDLFHESLSNEEIAAVFGAMAACPQHTFQVLTKRPKRAQAWFSWLTAEPLSVREGEAETCITEAYALLHANSPLLNATRPAWPLPNVWIGVSTENQKTAEERVPLLLDLPAAVRFVSAEPLLESVDLQIAAFTGAESFSAMGRLDWVIVGGESGHGARPCAVEWIERLIEQCDQAGTAVFVKQLGARVVSEDTDEEAAREFGFGSRWLWRAGLKDRKGADMSEWPENLQRQEFPAANAVEPTFTEAE